MLCPCVSMLYSVAAIKISQTVGAFSQDLHFSAVTTWEFVYIWKCKPYKLIVSHRETECEQHTRLFSIYSVCVCLFTMKAQFFHTILLTTQDILLNLKAVIHFLRDDYCNTDKLNRGSILLPIWLCQPQACFVMGGCGTWFDLKEPTVHSRRCQAQWLTGNYLHVFVQKVLRLLIVVNY